MMNESQRALTASLGSHRSILKPASNFNSPMITKSLKKKVTFQKPNPKDANSEEANRIAEVFRQFDS